MAKKKVTKNTKKYLYGPSHSDYVYDGVFASVKAAEGQAAERILEGGEDEVTLYELVPLKTIKVTVAIEEVK